jgi:hypothetical protein
MLVLGILLSKLKVFAVLPSQLQMLTMSSLTLDLSSLTITRFSRASFIHTNERHRD